VAHEVRKSGGTAGLTVAARLLNADPELDVAIIEPSQPEIYWNGMLRGRM
jgi:2-polyprenyl-6-methoxyphenol hydroxylase-like FAD-dependent oxidoreductase